MLSKSFRSSRVAAALAAVSALAVQARAQQFPSCPLTTNGADVICGSIQDAANYNVASGMDAVTLGTTSCNVGNGILNWISGTVNHPLMGGQVYKYKVVNGSGRFESLGQSWLKHAFLAFQENLCCANCSATDGQHLGIGCSAPYTASRNGTQSGLGPKYQVNANTGAYVAAPPHPTGGNNGRIQMLLGDLEASSASVRYFGEMMYIALDDAKNNNNDNNVSHRELSVAVGTATSGFTFGLTCSTQRMLPGLQAWKTIDAGVKLTNIASPESSVAPYHGNARLVLGSRVTDLGGGVWHYEYALYNQNSDRSVQSFRVPVPASATVTNVGFRDVAYLGNDGNGNVNFDGTDWPMVRAGDALTWATTPFAADANANALRWGTTYNFRFDADVAPSTGTVDLVQFKVVNGIAVPGVDVPASAPVFAAFCTNGSLGTDHTVACPCGNTGAAGNGCAHSFDAGGANLAATGTPAADDVVLTTQFEPAASFTLFMQHDAAGDAVFHDGVLCASGTLIRLRGRAAVAGVASFPNSAFAQDSTTTLSQRGGVTVGSGARRYYSAWFRNASTTFCPPATANVTNGWKLDW